MTRQDTVVYDGNRDRNRKQSTPQNSGYTSGRGYGESWSRNVASLTDPETLKKASLNNRAYAFTQVHQARRLEEGKSTENVNVLSKMIGQANADPFGKTTQPVGKSDAECA